MKRITALQKEILCNGGDAYIRKKELMGYGKKPFHKDDDDDHPKPPEEKTIIESTTDPESGVFHKGEHKKCFAYEAHTMCEKRGYVLEIEVTPGNVHDSVAFDTVFQKATEQLSRNRSCDSCAGYKTPWICKQIIDSGRIPSLLYKRPMTKKGNLPWYEYVYDEYYDCVLCPQYHVLSYSTTNRESYREYKRKSYICQNCPVREQCILQSETEKVLYLVDDAVYFHVQHTSEGWDYSLYDKESKC